MDSQETLARSYTDSISSYLYSRAAAEDEDNAVNQSIHSDLSHFANTGYTPNKGQSMIQIHGYDRASRRGSAMTDGASSYYDSIRGYEDSDEEEEQITPLPKMQMLIISIILLSEPLTSTILFPFIYFMLKDFHLSDDEKEIGQYAGWITSIFFVAQFCTAIMWGKVSDRFGRRPVLLIGLIGNSVSSCMFGLSKNLGWAIASRALCGIMNGNSGVARSMVSEITDNTNKAKAFAMFGFCWGAGMIGPALGGYLARPAIQFPELFGNCQFLIKYPYFLPCFVSSCLSMIGVVIGYFYLKESNPSVLAHKKWTATNKADESTALLNNHASSDANKSVPKSVSMRHITKVSIIVIISYSVFSFHAMVFDEILPLYFVAPVYAGGLGVPSTDFAKALSFFGIVQIIFQFGIYPKLTQRFSTLTLCRVAFFAFIPIYIFFPDLSTLREWIAQNAATGNGSQDWTFRFVYLLLLLIRFAGNCLAFTGLGIMVSTSAAPEILGTVNGICQSSVSLVRALGPTFGGTVWSISIRDGSTFPFDRHLVYYIAAILSLFNLIQSFYIPNSVALGGRKK